MTLGEVLEQAARIDYGGDGKRLPLKEGPFLYIERIIEGKFVVRLSSRTDENAYVETSIPYDALESTENYCRLHFLSMVYKAAIAGMKRKKQGQQNLSEAPAPWIAKIFEYCQEKRISPLLLIQFHRKWEKEHDQ